MHAKIGVDTAENEPEVDEVSSVLVLLMLSPANRYYKRGTRS